MLSELQCCGRGRPGATYIRKLGKFDQVGPRTIGRDAADADRLGEGRADGFAGAEKVLQK
jgi:hypothetical protein